METQATSKRGPRAPTGRARFRWTALALWLPVCLISAVLVAKAAVVVQSYFAPFLFFPLLVGLVLGAMLVAMMRFGQIANRPTILSGAVLAATLAALGQHYLFYRANLAPAEQELDEHPEARLGFGDELKDHVPTDLGDWLSKDADSGRAWLGKGLTVWLSWGLDAVLVLAATLAVVATSMRFPYCDRCRSWYRTTRAGELEVGAASEVAGLVGIRLPRRIRSAGFRFQACTGGCGPTAFELVWERPRGGKSSRRVWLDVDLRDRVSRVLDGEISGARPPAP